MKDTEPEAKRQLADVVVERIERLIVDGVLKQGQTLPSERRLTEKLGVSRTALREGLKILRARGLIETSQGKGSFVAKLTAEPAQTPMMHLLGSQPRTLYDLLEVREMLEAESARLAALRGTPADYILDHAPLRRNGGGAFAGHGRLDACAARSRVSSRDLRGVTQSGARAYARHAE